MRWIGRRTGTGDRAGFGLVLANPRMRDIFVSWTFSWTQDWLLPVAVAVYAYNEGGLGAAGLAGVVRMLPSTFAAPLLSVVVDRARREVVLRATYALQAVACLAMVAAFAASAPLWVLLALLAIEGFTAVLIQPATSALVPWIARTPEELTATNGALSVGRAVGIFSGPLLAGALLAVGTAGYAFLAAALLKLAAMALMFRVNLPGNAQPAPSRGHFVADMAVGFRVLGTNPAVLWIAGLLAGVQGILRGLFAVVAVVVAVELLDSDGAAAGYLQAAAGLGGVVAGLAVSLVVGRRMSDTFILGIVLRTFPFALVAAFPALAPAVLLMALNGVGNTAMVTGGFTLLQRLVPNASIGRTLGTVGMLTSLGVSAGSAAAAPLLATAGPRWVLAGMGLVYPLAAIAGWAVVRRADARAASYDAEVALLRGVPFFAALPLVAIEACAARVQRATARAGEHVIRQGEVGDRFYVLVAGQAQVLVDGREVATISPGGWFGEMALLHDVPRMATVTMVEDGELAFLRSHHFLEAVSFDPAATSTLGIDPSRAIEASSEQRQRVLANGRRDPAVVLASLPLLARVAPGEIERLASLSTTSVSAPGDTIVREGEPADDLYVVLDGELAVEIGGELVREIGAGSWFGELALLRRSPRTATVSARTAVTLLRVDGSAFVQAVEAATETPGSARLALVDGVAGD